MTVEKILPIVSQFVTETRGAPAQPIVAGTKLLADGLLDSFALVDLIGELETALSLSLPAGALIPEDFETPATLAARLTELG
jgi:acyl carrier protein